MARAFTSTPDVPDVPAQPGTALTRSSLYRAVWRWHFYAGLLVLPLLIWLAVTGALFVYHDAIDQRAHADLLTVPAASESAPHSAVLAAALAAQPGAWFKYTPAAAPGRSAEVGVRTADGAKVAVYLNPANAQVLGTLSDRGTLGWTIRKLHSLKYFGPVQRGFIEMAAGWAVLLVLTGLYLWWPRGAGEAGKGKAARGGVVSVRGTPRQRVYWRDLHAVTGLVVGVALLFLAITGMPWSVLWGAQANAWANGHNFGYPAGVRVQLPMSGQPLADAAHLPWTLQQTQQPGGVAHEGHAGRPAPGEVADGRGATGCRRRRDHRRRPLSPAQRPGRPGGAGRHRRLGRRHGRGRGRVRPGSGRRGRPSGRGAVVQRVAPGCCPAVRHRPPLANWTVVSRDGTQRSSLRRDGLGRRTGTDGAFARVHGSPVGCALVSKSFEDLYAELRERAATRPAGSGTVRELDAGVHEIGKKIVEEAAEVWMAAEYQSKAQAAEEVSQLIYHLQVLMISLGLELEDVYEYL